MNSQHESIDRSQRAQGRLLWIAIGIGLVLGVLLLSMVVGPRGVSPLGAAGKSGANGALMLSPADAARRAAIAKLGFIKPPGINAVDLYAEALKLLAKLPDPDRRLLYWGSHADPEAAARLHAEIQPIMQLLRKGQGADYADWGKTSYRHPEEMESERQTIAALTNVAKWEAGYLFKSDSQEALEDLAISEAVSRSATNSMSSFLAGWETRSNIPEIIAANAAPLALSEDAAILNPLVDPAAIIQDIQSTANSDEADIQYLIDLYNNPATHADTAALFKGLLSNSPGENPSDTGNVIRQLRWLQGVDEQLKKTILEPDAQFERWTAQVGSGVSFLPASDLEAIVESLQGMKASVDQTSVEKAMLNAGMALEQDDRAGFMSNRDPVSGMPFTVHQIAGGGFEIGSGFEYPNGNSLSLVFGSSKLR